jgi:hypothetical protein
MKKISATTPVIPVLVVMCLAYSGQPVLAGVDAECRQEADDYGIMPELRDEYVDGCIESRGGMSAPADIEEDTIPPSTPDDETYPEADNQQTLE